MKKPGSHWNEETGILRSELKGVVSAVDVEEWRAGLEGEVARISDGGTFKLLYDLHGYEPADIDAHKAMRNVIPELLARHGMRPAVVDLFPGAPDPPITTERGIRCTAFANVHHDPAKMADYERKIGRDDQRFFTELAAAERWLAER